MSCSRSCSTSSICRARSACAASATPLTDCANALAAATIAGQASEDQHQRDDGGLVEAVGDAGGEQGEATRADRVGDGLDDDVSERGGQQDGHVQHPQRCGDSVPGHESAGHAAEVDKSAEVDDESVVVQQGIVELSQ